ncbi:MAG: YdeI/OmpD-associated family protein [Tannerellaceae bacterium]|jgi:uncharacterized protein YdeI (YjbR/CyaY-like superfamily)|nr:YdeI/OmpD-associated family protein [Tannerellaceae bacterium]
MDNRILFADKEAFRAWLSDNHSTKGGIWLVFGKKNGPKSLTPDEAVEEALCFGWIDGLVKSIDDTTYMEYYSPRRKSSKWSERNKATAGRLEAQGRMTDYGRIKIEEAKKNGKWDAQAPAAITEVEIAYLSGLLKGREPARMNFEAMPLSVKKNYVRAYLDAKTDAGREKRLAWMTDRLNRNLKPM